MRAEPEPLNREGLAAFARRCDDDSPVVMLNLLRFEPSDGRERYAEYGAAVAPLLEEAGGRVVFAGTSDIALLGETCWDMVLLVEYPSREAFLDLIGSAEYQQIGHLRTQALVEGQMHPLDPGSF
jgi:uncharacterized protein (DUF1330 family)